MNMLTTLLSMFAGPVGNLLTTAIATGAASFVTYVTATGKMDVSTASTIAASGAGVAAALVNWGAGMLGVKIAVVNGGANGLKVVRDTAEAPKVNAPLK